jgi:ribonuclease E
VARPEEPRPADAPVATGLNGAPEASAAGESEGAAADADADAAEVAGAAQAEAPRVPVGATRPAVVATTTGAGQDAAMAAGAPPEAAVVVDASEGGAARPVTSRSRPSRRAAEPPAEGQVDTTAGPLPETAVDAEDVPPGDVLPAEATPVAVAGDRAPADEAPGDAVPADEAAGAAARSAAFPPPAPPSGPPPVPNLPPRPRIGDSRPAPPAAPAAGDTPPDGSRSGKRRRRRNRSRDTEAVAEAAQPVTGFVEDGLEVEIDEDNLELRRGTQRKGRPTGRYLMCVHVAGNATHIAILEGRTLLEHYVSRPSDDVAQIHGNIYLGRVQNVLPGMEAAFVDIGTPKNAVLYRGDVTFDTDDVEVDGGPAPIEPKGRGRRRRPDPSAPRIEDLLKARQSILCQVTKNPIAHKGARLTTEVSLPGRFVVLVPNSRTYGISKRLDDSERKRLRAVLDKVKPEQHGVIVRTAAEHVTEAEIARDVTRLLQQWAQIEKLAATTRAPALLFREPDLAVRVIREEFNKDYRSVVIDDPALFEQVRAYTQAVTPALAERIELYDPEAEGLSLYERHHITEQLRKAVDRKVWLPSGGSLIIEHTEALTVIDVNTGKNVGSSNLEETVFRNNLEAATEIARQLRLRDIGGIIVIDFIDMEVKANRDEVMKAFKAALGRDKTRTQVSDISDLGLVEMTRKRIGEGLVESVSHQCPACAGRGVQLDEELLGDVAQ